MLLSMSNAVDYSISTKALIDIAKLIDIIFIICIIRYVLISKVNVKSKSKRSVLFILFYIVLNIIGAQLWIYHVKHIYKFYKRQIAVKSECEIKNDVSITGIDKYTNCIIDVDICIDTSSGKPYPCRYFRYNMIYDDYDTFNLYEYELYGIYVIKYYSHDNIYYLLKYNNIPCVLADDSPNANFGSKNYVYCTNIDKYESIYKKSYQYRQRKCIKWQNVYTILKDDGLYSNKNKGKEWIKNKIEKADLLIQKTMSCR